MSHYKTSTKSIGRTHPDWLKVNASVGKIVNKWSLRQDLIVGLVEDTTIGAPACFNPALAEIEVCISKAFGNVLPAEVGELTNRKNQLKHPVAVGAIYHEALHARVSRWSLEQAAKDLNTRALRFMHAMEEGRIEYWGCVFLPENRNLLRACAMEIVLAEMDEQTKSLSKVDAAAYVALLSLARVDAGVLDTTDVPDAVLEILDTILGKDILRELREIWTEFQRHADHDNALPLYDLTHKFVEVLDKRKEEVNEQPDFPTGGCEFPGSSTTPQPSGDPQPGTPQPGGTGTPQPSGSGSEPTDEQIEEFKKFIEQVKDAIDEMKDIVQIANQDDINDELDMEERKDEVEQKDKAANEKRNRDKIANDTFSSGSHITSPLTNSRLEDTRSPSADEMAAANRIANALRKAKYRERSQVRAGSIVPPGRLRSRAVVQREALKAKGAMPQIETWRRTQRKQTDDPTLRVGVMVDISGSMRPAMKPMAITAWIMSEAVRRIQGKCAMVYYGQDIFATLKPGQKLDKVKTYTATDSTEEFAKAFKALDGGLNLVHGDGARLLVVVSDGRYRGDQQAYAKQLLAEADRNGVAILWLTFDGKTAYATEYLKGTAGEIVSLVSTESPVKASQVIGQTAAKAVSAIGSRV